MNRPRTTLPSPAQRQLSRRAALQRACGTGLALAAGLPAFSARAAQDATPVADTAQALPPDIIAVMAQPRYRDFTQWGIYAVDRETGEAIYDLNSVQRFVPGSTTKLFPAAAALVTYGPDYRFETPVYRQGTVTDGALDGDLILVASGDITMGGRDLPDGTLAHGNIDHTDANAVPGFAILSDTDPLAGLDHLAEQVAAAGITQAADVIVDARLWDQMPKDDYILSPIMINDNVIDLTTIPGKAGAPAGLEWRPMSAFYDVRTEVQTVGAGEPLNVTVTSPAPDQIVVTGQIPEGNAPLLQTFQVEDPPAFARALFIEALARYGVTVEAEAIGPNPSDRLPASDAYQADDRVALLTSLPFSQVIELILKVSLNQGADTLVFLLAVHDGQRTFDDGLAAIKPFLASLGVDASAISLADGRGNERADLFSPRSVASLLMSMAARPEFAAYHDALPILGVDGTEWMSLPETSPARGHVVAKSGTTVDGDLLNQEYLLLGKADAGYMTTSSGRDLVWAVYVNDVLSANLEDVLGVGADIGAIAEAIYVLN
jgi:D-alanyl-D-alanine carboxypeptidase/D-alanyl-D-alanine-endopeptidase (penicillin-binding protein 4)